MNKQTATVNCLIIGAGGREHALAWKIRQSPLLNKLYCSPGNGGTIQQAESVSLAGHDAIAEFCHSHNIGLVVIGPEQPLVDGLSDYLRQRDITVFGCSKAAAQLEGSKSFTKKLCRKYGIPTADYAIFTEAQPAKDYISKQNTPIVIKADGLAAGKGVIIAKTIDEAEAAIDDIFAGKFGSAGKSIIIEEWLRGEEISFFALCDGKTILPLASAQDHKTVGEGDTGPNTGGMGTYSPAPIATEEINRQIMQQIIEPTIAAMQDMGTPFTGVLFAGLMITDSGPKLIEYNIRFGDPETQSIMMRLKSDIMPALLACAKGEGLKDIKLELSEDSAMCVVMAAKGYPGDYVKNTEIHNLDIAAAENNIYIFHAGTKQDDGKIIACGGRVLGVTATGTNIFQARDNAYNAIAKINWPEGFYRKDIGWRAMRHKAA